MILWDSNKRGRPDTMELLKATWTSFGAEVIFITSNMQGNDEMMQGCRAGTSISILIHSKSLTSENQLDYTHSAPCGTSDCPSSTLGHHLRCTVVVAFVSTYALSRTTYTSNREEVSEKPLI